MSREVLADVHRLAEAFLDAGNSPRRGISEAKTLRMCGEKLLAILPAPDPEPKADEGLRERLDLVLLSHDADFEAAIKGRRPVPMTLAERLEQFVISEIERAKNGKS